MSTVGSNKRCSCLSVYQISLVAIFAWEMSVLGLFLGQVETALRRWNVSKELISPITKFAPTELLVGNIRIQ